MSAITIQTNTKRKANRIEEEILHKIDILQKQTLDTIIVNSKRDTGSKTAIETITIIIVIKIGKRIADMEGMDHEEITMIIEDVTLTMTIIKIVEIKLQNKMNL